MDKEKKAKLTVIWDPAGKRVATSSDQERDIMIWRLDSSELIDLACRRSGRNLTYDEYKRYLPADHLLKTCNDRVKWPLHPSFLEEAERMARLDHDSFVGDKDWHLDEETLNEAIALMERIAKAEPVLVLKPAQHVRQIATNGLLERAEAGLNDNPNRAFRILRATLEAYPDVKIEDDLYNRFCLKGSIFGRAEDAHWVCKRARTQEGALGDWTVPLGSGLTEARMGDRESAIEYLRIARDHLLSSLSELAARWPNTYLLVSDDWDAAGLAREIEKWISEMKEGGNPIDDATLEALKCSSNSELREVCFRL